MPRFRDFEASILVDGAPLPEYEEDEGAERAQDGSPVRTVFVEAQTGKRFRVRVNVLCNESEYYDVRIAVDGKKLNRSYCKRGREFIKEGELIGAGRFAQRVPLIFAEAKLMSDADGPEAEALYEEQKHLKIQAGRVVVQFFPCVQAGWKDYGDKAPSSISEQLVLHEKVKKGFVSHTAAYGLPVPEPQVVRMRTFQRTSDIPLATIRFDYRSRILLEALGFTLPPCPESLVAPEHSPPSTISRTLKREAEPLVAVKTEKRSKTDRVIKIEDGPTKAYKVQSVGGLVTIDLTEDD